MKEINIERLITDYKILVSRYICSGRIQADQIKDIDKRITVAMMVYNVFAQASGYYVYYERSDFCAERLEGVENAMTFSFIEEVIRSSMYYYFVKIINNDARDEIMRSITHDTEYDILKRLLYYDDNLKYEYIKADNINLFAGLIKSVDIIYRFGFEGGNSNDEELVKEWHFVKDFEADSGPMGSFFRSAYGYPL